MKNEMVDYKIVTGHSIEILGAVVGRHIEEDWQPFGSPYVYKESGNVNDYHAQAMVKYKVEKIGSVLPP